MKRFKTKTVAISIVLGGLSINSAMAQYVGNGTTKLQTPLQQYGKLWLGESTTEADRQRCVLQFGDGDYVRIGEFEADDRLSFKATSYNFVNGSVTMSSLTASSLAVSNSARFSNVYAGFTPNFEGATSYQVSGLGFNAYRSGTSWYTGSDGAHNGAGAITTGVFGDMIFYTFPTGSSGSTTGAISDEQSKNNITLRLTSSGTVVAKAIDVKANVWADFVFDKNYKLRPLKEVEQHIAQYKHLPDVPSEAEIKESGIHVAEMNALLMQKIEENTLYLIDLQKQNDELKKQVEMLTKLLVK